MVFQIGVEPSRIDILTAISGVEFDHAWANRLAVEMDDIQLSVIGRTDLIVNKRACGAPKTLRMRKHSIKPTRKAPVRQHGFYADSLLTHLPSLATGHGLGTISSSSCIRML